MTSHTAGDLYLRSTLTVTLTFIMAKKKKKSTKEQPSPSPLLMQASRRRKAVIRWTFVPLLWLHAGRKHYRISKHELWGSAQVMTEPRSSRFCPHQGAHCLLRQCINIQDSYSDRESWMPHTLRSFRLKEHAPSQGPGDLVWFLPLILGNFNPAQDGRGRFLFHVLWWNSCLPQKRRD